MFLSSIISSTFLESFARFFLLFSLSLSLSDLQSLFLDSRLISFKSLLATISRSHPVVFLALGFGRHVTPADAVCPTRAFAFSSRVSEHSIVPVRTISYGRAELALSFYQPVDSPAATPLLANATDIPRSTRPTRIGNQFRKTVINGRRRTVRAPGVRGPNRAACGNRAAFEWPLPVFVDDSAKTLRALDFPVTFLRLFEISLARDKSAFVIYNYLQTNQRRIRSVQHRAKRTCESL